MRSGFPQNHKEVHTEDSGDEDRDFKGNQSLARFVKVERAKWKRAQRGWDGVHVQEQQQQRRGGEATLGRPLRLFNITYKKTKNKPAEYNDAGSITSSPRCSANYFLLIPNKGRPLMVLRVLAAGNVAVWQTWGQQRFHKLLILPINSLK